MNGIRFTSIAAGLGIALGGAAVAQNQAQTQSQSRHHQSFQSSEQGQRASQEMMRLDRDRDERVSQQEAQSDPQLVAAWAEIDVTRDGSIDATEYYLYAAQRRIAELETGSAGQAQARSGQSSSDDRAASAQSSNQSSAGQQQDARNERSGESVIAQADPGEQRSDAAGRADQRSDRSTSSDQPSFDEADRNNDGQIDRQEYQLTRRL